MSKVLVEKTIEVLERDGWCQRKLTNDQGQHCVLGAIVTATNESGTSHLDYMDTRRELNRLITDWGRDDMAIVRWNDAKHRRKGQVLRKLRKLKRRLS